MGLLDEITPGGLLRVAEAAKAFAGKLGETLGAFRYDERSIGQQRGGLSLGLLALLVIPVRAVELDIPLFAGGYGTAFYEESAREFEKLRPDVRIKIYGDPRISDKLRVRIIDGNLPDAMLPFDVLIPALVNSGKLRELTPYLDQPNWEGDARWGDTFVPGAFDAWRIGNGVYGLPLSYACWTIFYNRALFRTHGWEVPKTWEEFFTLCDRIQAAGLAPVSLTGIFSNYPDAIVRSAYYNLAGAEGWQRLNGLAPGAWSDPRYARAAAVLQRITQNYALRGWDGATHTAAQLAFVEGRAAMCVSGSWMIYEMGDKIPADFDIGVMNFPVFPDGIADPTTIQAGADNLFVFATGNPERERATIDFLRFLTSRTRIRAFVKRTDSPAAVRGTPIGEFSPRMQAVATMIGQAKESFNMPQRMLQPPAIRQVLIDARLELMAGRITPEEFGRRVEAAADIDRRRAAQPNQVDYRYPVAGSALLALLAVIGLWAARGRRQFQLGGNAAAGSAESVDRSGFFGRLRPAVAVGFVGPAFALFAGLVLLPGLAAFLWAFTRWDGMGERAWAGLFNFKWLLFESDLFWAALKNNLFLMLVPTATVLPLALALAYALHRGVLGANFFRAVFLFPNLLGGIAATLLWMSAYAPHGGLVNAGIISLGSLLHIDAWRNFDGFPWLAPRNLYWALVPIYLWMACGFNLVLYLAAMEGIDPQLYEAAELDGASRPRQFFRITLPLIWEVVVISAVFIVIAGLNAFEMIWLLTQQDPDTSTHTLGTFMVTSMFKDFQVGRATAIAVMLFLLVLAASAAVMRGLKREAIE